MNAKSWIVWVCLAVMLGSEFFLFRANHQRDVAKAELTGVQQQLHDVQAELDTLKSSSAGGQAGEASGLRKQNDLLAAKVKDLQRTVDALQAKSQQAEQHLNTARSALQLQQEHLAQLQVEQQQATVTANANNCINNLRMIDAAKTQWALEKNKTTTDVPTSRDLQPYFKDGVFPVCPGGGMYTINSMSELPSCSVQGHVLTLTQ